MNANKNNKVIIEAIAKLQNKNIHYCLCGVGDQQIHLQTQTDNAGLHDNVHFLGYRSDVKDLLLMADVYVMPSKREGLSRSLMEAMACGLPCIVSRIRGNVDLIEKNVGGILCDDRSGYEEACKRLMNNQNRGICGFANKRAINKFSADNVIIKLQRIYMRIV